MGRLGHLESGRGRNELANTPRGHYVSARYAISKFSLPFARVNSPWRRLPDALNVEPLYWARDVDNDAQTYRFVRWMVFVDFEKTALAGMKLQEVKGRDDVSWKTTWKEETRWGGLLFLIRSPIGKSKQSILGDASTVRCHSGEYTAHTVPHAPMMIGWSDLKRISAPFKSTSDGWSRWTAVTGVTRCGTGDPYRS